MGVRIDLSLIAPYVPRMASCVSASDRRAVVEEMCGKFAISTAKAYKALGEAGWSSGRKTQKDAGSTSADAHTLGVIAAMRRLGQRGNGKDTMPVNVAASVYEMNGNEIGVGVSRVRQLLRERELSARSLKAPSPHYRMRSLHPNHVHCVDPSVCLIYFAPQGASTFSKTRRSTKTSRGFRGKRT